MREKDAMETDILVIGGGPAGVVAAVTAKKNNSGKKVVLVRTEEKAIVPCGIPYIFSRLDSVEKNIAPDKSLEANKIDLVIDKASNIDTTNKIALLEKNKEIVFDKLVLATGSKSILIPIKGADKKGVWQIKKELEYLKKLRQAVLESKDIVIIGGGFIGVELAEELSRIDGLKISIIEKLGHCLITTFDREFAIAAEEKLKEKNVDIYTNSAVKEIEGNDRVKSVKLENGKEIPADLVILSIGAKPNVDLIQDTKIKTGEYNGIWVDEYMKTNTPDIFAVGDCAETKDLFTGKHIPVMLASTACSEARIACANLYKLKNLKENNGTLGSFSTYINGLILSTTGMTEQRAKTEKLEVVVGTSECPNHHPGTLPNTQTIKINLVASKSSGVLLGAQIMGPESISEMVNILALAIQKETSIYDLDTLQISTHPLLSAAPTVYPIITAAQSAIAKLG